MEARYDLKYLTCKMGPLLLDGQCSVSYDELEGVDGRQKKEKDLFPSCPYRHGRKIRSAHA